MKKIVLLVIASLCLSVPGFAQTRPGPRNGGYIAGVGGMTFGTESDTLFGGEVGVEATRNITVYGTGGRMQNIAPNRVSTLEVNLAAGSYVIICNVAGHYQLGMRAALKVEP